MIWQTLGQVMDIVSYCQFHNASKECFWPKKNSNFMHRFKSAILAIFSFCQNGTFEPVHEIQIFFAHKTSFEALWKCHLQKIFITFSKVRQIQDLGQSKYKLRLFSKRTHEISKIIFLGFLWIPSQPFLVFINVKKQCVGALKYLNINLL